MIKSLDVMLWGRKVGMLVSTPHGYRSQICFYFDADYVKNGLDLAPLRASINGVAARSGLPVYPDEEKIFGGLPSFIADSMPDHWGNVIFDEWARINKINKRDLTALDRLAYIGRRGMGALEFVPSVAESTINGSNQDVSFDDVMAVAERYGVKAASSIMNDVKAVVGNYRQYALEAGVPEGCIRKIEVEIADRLSNF